jgi:hypothetical protein
MTHFQDLDAVHYAGGPHDADNWNCPLLAIGWLERGKPFSTGTSSAAWIDKLLTLRNSFGEAFEAYSFRGWHECSICETASGTLEESHVNLFIPGRGVIFLATGRVDHYMTAHGYAAPQAFIDAVMECPDPTTAAYAQVLFELNGGKRPPLFPEQWRIVRSDDGGCKESVYECDTETVARRLAASFEQRQPGQQFDVEKLQDPWIDSE